MSGESNRQSSSQYSEASSYCGDTSDDESMDEEDYYNDYTDDLSLDCPSNTEDPEHYECEFLQTIDVERLLNERIEALCTRLKVQF